MLRNAFFREIGPLPPRNANNVDIYTFVTLFSGKVDTPHPHLRNVTLEWPLSRNEIKSIIKNDPLKSNVIIMIHTQIASNNISAHLTHITSEDVYFSATAPSQHQSPVLCKGQDTL